ncbi:MAG: hypothetical protein PHI71_17870 [Acidiphilium sp.]|nr:hypothetical protein [Acidiphilium sp.]
MPRPGRCAIGQPPQGVQNRRSLARFRRTCRTFGTFGTFGDFHRVHLAQAEGIDRPA